MGGDRPRTGYPAPSVDILGISFGIDTSACLVRDGHTISAVLEERFSRIKHDRGWPAKAIAHCLEAGDTSLDQVDSIAFFWNPALQLDFPHPGRSRTYRHHGDYLHMVPSWLLGGLSTPVQGPWTRQTIALDGRNPLTITYVTHHLCHAAAAFFPSPYDSAAVLTVDGYGERASACIGSFDESSMFPICTGFLSRKNWLTGWCSTAALTAFSSAIQVQKPMKPRSNWPANMVIAVAALIGQSFSQPKPVSMAAPSPP